MATNNAVPWTRAHTLSAFYLYTQMPFGRLHSKAPEIRELAEWQGRTAGSLAMKLVNFASLDPAITSTGRAGLSGASSQDRKLWEELNLNWDKVMEEATAAYRELAARAGSVVADIGVVDPLEEEVFAEGKTREVVVKVRANQSLFRRAVLTNYNSTCCISGLSNPKLLVASHIVPWTDDTENRLNPRNGLCLSAIHDRAFDRGLMTVMPDMTIRVSPKLHESFAGSPLLSLLVEADKRPIAHAQKFAPAQAFLSWHATHFGYL